MSLSSDNPKTWEVYKHYKSTSIPEAFAEALRNHYAIRIGEEILLTDIPEHLCRIFYLSELLLENGIMRWGELYKELFWMELRSANELPDCPVGIRFKPGTKQMLLVKIFRSGALILPPYVETLQ